MLGMLVGDAASDANKWHTWLTRFGAWLSTNSLKIWNFGANCSWISLRQSQSRVGWDLAPGYILNSLEIGNLGSKLLLKLWKVETLEQITLENPWDKANRGGMRFGTWLHTYKQFGNFKPWAQIALEKLKLLWSKLLLKIPETKPIEVGWDSAPGYTLTVWKLEALGTNCSWKPPDKAKN